MHAWFTWNLYLINFTIFLFNVYRSGTYESGLCMLWFVICKRFETIDIYFWTSVFIPMFHKYVILFYNFWNYVFSDWGGGWKTKLFMCNAAESWLICLFFLLKFIYCHCLCNILYQIYYKVVTINLFCDLLHVWGHLFLLGCLCQSDSSVMLLIILIMILIFSLYCCSYDLFLELSVVLILLSQIIKVLLLLLVLTLTPPQSLFECHFKDSYSIS